MTYTLTELYNKQYFQEDVCFHGLKVTQIANRLYKHILQEDQSLFP